MLILVYKYGRLTEIFDGYQPSSKDHKEDTLLLLESGRWKVPF